VAGGEWRGRGCSADTSSAHVLDCGCGATRTRTRTPSSHLCIATASLAARSVAGDFGVVDVDVDRASSGCRALQASDSSWLHPASASASSASKSRHTNACASATYKPPTSEGGACRGGQGLQMQGLEAALQAKGRTTRQQGKRGEGVRGEQVDDRWAGGGGGQGKASQLA